MSDTSGRERARARAMAMVNDGELIAIIEAIMDGVYIYSADGRLRLVNSAGKRLLALDRKPDFATMPMEQRVPLLAPLDDRGRPLLADAWPARRILRGEELRADRAVEVRVRALDGRLVDLSIAGAPLRNAAGQVIGAVTIMRDVTARRRLERRSHDALNALLEMAEALVSLPRDASGAAPIDEVAALASENDEDDAADVSGASATPTHAETPAPIVGESERPTETATSAQLAGLIRSVLGLRRVAVLLTQPGSGAITLAASVGLAPAEERRWRERLAEATLTDLLPDGALRDQLQADEPLALDAWRGASRVHADALAPFSARPFVIAPMRIGQQMIGLLVLGADDDAVEAPDVREANMADTSDSGNATVGDGANGARAQPAHTGKSTGQQAEEAAAFPSEELALAGAVARMAALVIERERLIQERAEERARRIALSDANERMDEFLAIASHELKSPLTSIKANVQLARRRIRRMPSRPASPAPGAVAEQAAPNELAAPPTEANAQADMSALAEDDPRIVAMELLQRTEQQITRLNRLVDDLLDTSRIQARKLELRLTPCDLAQLARDVVEEQRQSQPARTITLAAPHQPVMIDADPDRVRQVITNYVTNALKYSPADRPVAVALTTARRHARLAVCDQGPGLPPDEQSRVWERFHRAPGVEQVSGMGVGLGLGLHISRTLIERLGGRVGVESAVGQGSTFWFTLPLLRQR